MKCESGVTLYTPKRFFNRGDITIEQASKLIHLSASQGLMLEHSPQELRGMARKNRLMMLVTKGPEEKDVVVVAGVTQVHRSRRIKIGKIDISLGRVKAAEFGALATSPEYSGNGYGPEITKAVAKAYLQGGLLSRIWQSPDVRLFAMAGLTNAASNNMFRKLAGEPMNQALLPEDARDLSYNAYDITHLGRRSNPITAKTVI